MHINEIIQAIYPLPQAAAGLLKEHIMEVSFPKGHILFRQDKIENTLYFIKKGIVRAYARQEDNDITFWFGKEGDPVLSMKSYVERTKGYENVELLEDAELYQLKANELETLYLKDIHIANWGRKLAEKELVKTEERLISRQFKTASERYSELMRYSPHLLQRVQLGHIASYLGITQVSLSRIRAELK
ncbi:Crp/Fnr family transcriptional regulator [Filimonas effusa]|uniref:Crp/Fnr family transcriptional regulator n=1 Tax=Filimonas effusa TaxID=2508721 RepID=A0A4Q1D3Y5_9BACT|nr:Crp/Fnr family transcriptional regulator [Filimonas effusa]RXK83130.1 Crp/Fnr family transcriptional regulator [Filimonas effusa]